MQQNKLYKDSHVYQWAAGIIILPTLIFLILNALRSEPFWVPLVWLAGTLVAFGVIFGVMVKLSDESYRKIASTNHAANQSFIRESLIILAIYYIGMGVLIYGITNLYIRIIIYVGMLVVAYIWIDYQAHGLWLLLNREYVRAKENGEIAEEVNKEEAVAAAAPAVDTTAKDGASKQAADDPNRDIYGSWLCIVEGIRSTINFQEDGHLIWETLISPRPLYRRGEFKVVLKDPDNPQSQHIIIQYDDGAMVTFRLTTFSASVMDWEAVNETRDRLHFTKG